MAILLFWERRMDDARKFPRRSYFCEEHQAWHITAMSAETYADRTQNAPGRDRT